MIWYIVNACITQSDKDCLRLGDERLKRSHARGSYYYCPTCTQIYPYEQTV